MSKYSDRSRLPLRVGQERDCSWSQVESKCAELHEIKPLLKLQRSPESAQKGFQRLEVGQPHDEQRSHRLH
jgi:hypothetical protein